MSSHYSEPDTFEDRLEILRDELALAVQFDRPSILFAIYASMLVRQKAEAWLGAQIHGMGQSVVHLRITPTTADIPTLIYGHPGRGRAVFFISALSRGGGKGRRDTYRALNLRREHFVERPARLIFWLTRAEAKALPRYAPDFWAFRHRVVEFFDLPDPHAVPVIRMPASRDERSAAYWNNLGNRHFSLGLWEDALGAYRKAIRCDAGQSAPQHNLGQLFAAMERWADSAQALRKAIRLAPDDSAARIALAQVYDQMDRPKDADRIRQKLNVQAEKS